MKKNNSFLTLFFAISLLNFMIIKAQSNYKPGVVVTKDGDSIHGYLNDKDWAIAPDHFEFKPDPNKEYITNMTLENTCYVEINHQEAYQKYTVSVSLNHTKFPDIPELADTSWEKRTVFLNVLLKGCRLHLFSYTDKIKTRFYVWDTSEDHPVELKYLTFYSSIGKQKPNDGYDESTDRPKVVTRNYYIGQLSLIANRYGLMTKELKRIIENAQYSLEDLVKIVTIINGGNNQNFCNLQIANNKIKMHFFIAGHGRTTSLKMMELKNSQSVSSSSNRNTFLSFSPSMGIDLKKMSGSRLFVREELSLSWDKVHSSDICSKPANYYTNTYSYQFSQWNLCLDNQLIYDLYHSKKTNAYIGAGLGLNLLHINHSEYTEHITELYSQTDHKTESILSPQLFWFSIPYKIGVLIKEKYNVDVTGYLPLSITDNGWSRKLITWKIGVGYFFN